MKFAFIHVEKASSPVDWLCSAWMSRAAATTHGLIAVLRAGRLKTRGLRPEGLHRRLLQYSQKALEHRLPQSDRDGTEIDF